jgi:hypothetical protein
MPDEVEARAVVSSFRLGVTPLSQRRGAHLTEAAAVPEPSRSLQGGLTRSRREEGETQTWPGPPGLRRPRDIQSNPIIENQDLTPIGHAPRRAAGSFAPPAGAARGRPRSHGARRRRVVLVLGVLFADEVHDFTPGPRPTVAPDRPVLHLGSQKSVCNLPACGSIVATQLHESPAGRRAAEAGSNPAVQSPADSQLSEDRTKLSSMA